MFITVSAFTIEFIQIYNGVLSASAQHRRRERTARQIRMHRTVGTAAQHTLVEEREDNRQLERLSVPLQERSLQIDNIASVSW